MTLVGAGTASVLKLMAGDHHDIVDIPATQKQPLGPRHVRNISIAGLTFDGRRNGAQPLGQPNYFGVFVRAATHVVLSKLYLHNFFYDAIEIGGGTQDVLVRNCHVRAARRNAISIVGGSNVRVTDTWIQDSPTQEFGPSAGNGIDIEVEESYVDHVTVERSLIERQAPTTTAGAGIAIQPGYFPASNVLLAGNVVKNYATGIGVVGTPAAERAFGRVPARGVAIVGNWIVNNYSQVAGVAIFGAGTGTVHIARNFINATSLQKTGQAKSGADYVYAVELGRNVAGVTVDRNFLMGEAAALSLRATVSGLSAFRNLFDAPKLLMFGSGATVPANVSPSEISSMRAPAPSTRPPVVSLRVEGDSRMTASSIVSITPRSTTPVARVMLFVDGIPQGELGRSPYRFMLNPGAFTTGAHQIAALALGYDSEVSAMVTRRVYLCAGCSRTSRDSRAG